MGAGLHTEEHLDQMIVVRQMDNNGENGDQLISTVVGGKKNNQDGENGD